MFTPSGKRDLIRLWFLYIVFIHSAATIEAGTNGKRYASSTGYWTRIRRETLGVDGICSSCRFTAPWVENWTGGDMGWGGGWGERAIL